MRALMTPYLPWFHQTKVVCAAACYKTHTNTVTTMAVAGINGLLPPHTRHCASCLHVKLMGDYPWASRYNFGVGWESKCPSMRSFVPVMMHRQNINIRVFWGSHTPSTTHKIISAYLGSLLSIKQRRWCGAQGVMWGTQGPFPPASAMVRCGSQWLLVAGEVRLFYSFVFNTILSSDTAN